MGYERNRGTGWRGDDYERQYQQGDYGAGRTGGYSSARDYQASGSYDRDGDRGGRGYGQRDDMRGYGNGDRGGSRYGQNNEYHGSYASDGRRFEDVGDRRDWDDDNRGDNRDRDRNRSYGQRGYGQSGYGQSGRGQGGYGQDRNRFQNRDDRQGRSYGGQPEGYDYQDRGFFDRAGDEVRSWFGDEDAERRREMDSRYDERYYNQRGNDERDSHYSDWRAGQIAAFDRDYDEYRNENRTKFHKEFSDWRSERQGQRDSLSKVQEHTEVVGSDGSHVGTVDKVRGDRIILTKNDEDAGGQHHSIPSRWIQTADDKKVTLTKTADEAKSHWRNEEQNQAMFGSNDDKSGDKNRDKQAGGSNLNRSFSGTY